MSYQIKINIFEGPHDLLLFLIKKGEIDIYDIPIAKITKEYLEYIEVMQSLNLEIAGEFIVMAATLMRIKSKMLLPVHVEEEEEIEDPRYELIQNLLEYQKIKEAAEKFERLEYERSHYYLRGNFSQKGITDNNDEDFDMQMTTYELVVVFNEIFKKKTDEKFHVVKPDPVTIEEKMTEILDLFKEHKKVSFQKHFMNIHDIFAIVINFLAILELVKRRQLIVSQAQPFKEIWISRRLK